MFYELLKNYDDILSVKEVQCILKIGKNQAYELVTNGDIQSIRIGRVYKISKDKEKKWNQLNVNSNIA